MTRSLKIKDGRIEYPYAMLYIKNFKEIDKTNYDITMNDGRFVVTEKDIQEDYKELLKFLKRYGIKMLSVMDGLTYDLCYQATQLNGECFKYIPDEFIDDKMVKHALSYNTHCIKFTPERYLTEDNVLYALKNNVCNITKIKKKFLTKEICEFLCTYTDKENVNIATGGYLHLISHHLNKELFIRALEYKKDILSNDTWKPSMYYFKIEGSVHSVNHYKIVVNRIEELGLFEDEEFIIWLLEFNHIMLPIDRIKILSKKILLTLKMIPSINPNEIKRYEDKLRKEYIM